MTQPLPRVRAKRYLTLVEAAVAAGWTWRINGSSHLELMPPHGGKGIWISTSLTDKDPRCWMNTRAALRRAGVKV